MAPLTWRTSEDSVCASLRQSISSILRCFPNINPDTEASTAPVESITSTAGASNVMVVPSEYNTDPSLPVCNQINRAPLLNSSSNCCSLVNAFSEQSAGSSSSLGVIKYSPSNPILFNFNAGGTETGSIIKGISVCLLKLRSHCIDFVDNFVSAMIDEATRNNSLRASKC